MAQQTFKRGAMFPTFPNGATGPPSFSNSVTDAANEIFACVITAPKTGNIRGVWYRPTVTTGSTTTVGAYAVSTTTGDPGDTPTPLAANTFVAQVVTTLDSLDVVYSGNFTADASVTKGQVFAICWIQPAVSAGSISFQSLSDDATQFPYTTLFTGTWAKTGQAPMLMLEYSDGTVEIPAGCHLWGDAAATALPVSNTLGTATTPDIAGARFSLPGPVRCNGAWVWTDFDGECNVKLVTADWDGSTSGLLATAAFDNNVRTSGAAGIHRVEFEVTVDLSAATYYRLICEPTQVTTMVLYSYPCVDADHFGAQPLSGANFHLTTAKDPNDNTDFTNYDNGTDGYRVPLMGLLIDGISDGAGGASSGGKFFGG